jgi:hypothetical protein
VVLLRKSIPQRATYELPLCLTLGFTGANMKFTSFLIIIGCAIAPLKSESAEPATVKSSFGFDIALPADWVQVGPKQASKGVPNAKELGIEKANKTEIEKYVSRVKNEKVEFYLDATHSDEQFTNNISIQLENEANDYSQYTAEEIQNFCASVPSGLSSSWGETVNFKACNVVASNGIAVLAFSYIVPSQEIFILQYVIPFNSKQTLLLVGGGRINKDGVSRMQTAIRAIASGVTAREK